MSRTDPSTIAVIDVGKTNIKLMVVGDTGEVVEQLAVGNEVVKSGIYPHFAVDTIFEWVLTGLTELAKRHPIRAIVPVTHGATGVLCTKDGLALPVLDYEFNGPDSVSADYQRAVGAFPETCSPDLPGGLNFGKQLYWSKREFPKAFAKVEHILMYPQYFTFRLTGQRYTEVTSLGCHTGLWDPAERRFSEFARTEGFEEKFPLFRRAYESAGRLLPELARRTGLSPDVVVLTGIHDSNASYFAHAAPRQGIGEFAVASTGTWVVCMASGVSLSGLREELGMLANCDAFGNPVASISFMGGREYEAVAGADGLLATPSTEDVTRVLATTTAVPSFAPQGGPFRTHTGRIEGEMLADPKAKAALASVYTALLTDHCLDLLGAKGDLIVDGAFTKNIVFLGLLASLRTEKTFVSDAAYAGTARGAAQLVAWPTPLEGQATVVEAMENASLLGYRERWRQYLEKPSR